MADREFFVVVKNSVKDGVSKGVNVVKDALDPNKTRFTIDEDAGKNGFGTGKVGQWLNKQFNRMTDDYQTNLGETPKSDKTPGRSGDPQTYQQRVQSYSTPYSTMQEVPAAMSVGATWTKDDGNRAFTGNDGRLGYSLFNRYALYNFRGFYGGDSPSLAAYYTDAENQSGDKFRPNELRGLDLYDVTEQKIIKYYNDFYPYIAYSPTDFLYNKYFQEIPVNHLVTLRRFAMPCEDNIFRSDTVKETDGSLSKTVHLSTCTATTYFGEKTENKLDEILKFTGVGLSWERKEAKLQEIQAGSSTKGEGKFDHAFGTNKSGLFAALSGKSAGDIYKAEKFGGASDPMHKYSSFVLGPVNVIDNTNIRGRGINFKNDYELKFEYELKSWYMVNPKIAMLDILSNMLVMTTNNGNFWGGGWRYTGGQSRSRITDLYGDSSLLRKGDFIGYAQSVVTDVIHGKPGPNGTKQPKGITGLFGDGSGGFSFKSILTGIWDIMQNILTQKIGSFMDSFAGGLQNPGSDIPQALLSAQPTGYWHVTIGNPLNPIAIMGNMICKDNDFTLGGGLGYDDFPMEFKVSVKLEHGKPRDRSDIENMFNMGNGRIYAAPADEGSDILNIAGKEVQEYGVYPVGPGMHMGIDTVAKNIGLGREHVANIISMDILS